MVKVTALTNEYISPLLSAIRKEEGEEFANRLKIAIENLQENQEVLICTDCDTGKIVGYSLTTSFAHAILSLDYIYVLPSFRRDSNGSIILVAIYNKAVNKLIAGLVAKCENDNEVGNAFLKARGFILLKTEENINYYSKSLMHIYITHEHKD